MQRDVVYMIHEYDGVDLGIVWETVLKNLPDLVDEVDKILHKISE